MMKYSDKTFVSYCALKLVPLNDNYKICKFLMSKNKLFKISILGTVPPGLNLTIVIMVSQPFVVVFDFLVLMIFRFIFNFLVPIFKASSIFLFCQKSNACDFKKAGFIMAGCGKNGSVQFETAVQKQRYINRK